MPAHTTTTDPPDTGLGQDAPRSPGRGDTQWEQGEDQRPQPREPAARDESADQQSAEHEQHAQQAELARRDLERGLRDTSKGAELDATYDQLRDGLPGGQKQFRP